MNLFTPIVNLLAKAHPSAKRLMHKFNGGVFPKYNKSLSASQPIRAKLIPQQLILPLQQQVGLPPEVKVQVGDKVKKNQLLAQPSKDPFKALSVPVHAPTSGTITAIQPITLPHPSGLEDQAIILEPDGLDEALDNILGVDGTVPESPLALKEILLNAGIVGMGGAGFPTYAKIPNQRGKIHTLLINGAECEPFITCDDLLMQTEADSIIQGALITAEALGAERIICGIESNKPAAIKAMQKAAANNRVEIKVVETVYPMGGQKQLTLELTGVEMPHKAHAVDIGMLMMNVATYTAIYRAVTFGEPLTSRLVTVSGLGLNQPFNMHVLIGTPFSTLAQAAQPKTELNYPLVMGGPMMGFKVANNDVPVIKTTNCILANPPEPVEMQMPCIRCGDCMDACPVNLLPQQMYWHSQAHEFDKVEKLNVFDCIECGCCSYVCPSHIPLVQYYRHAKSEIKEIHAEKEAVELAKQRHEFRLARIEREKQEREARLKAKKEAVKKEAAKAPTDESAGKKTSSAAAAAKAAAAKRAAAKGQQASSTEEQTETKMPSARLKAIEAAKLAAQKSVKRETSDADTDTKQDAAPMAKPDPKAAAKQAAMLAAKKRAQAKAQQTAETTDLTQETATTEASEKESARKAAMQTARAAAKKRAEAKADKTDSIGEEEITQPNPPPPGKTPKDGTVDKRKAAMEAAKAAAKKRAAEKAALEEKTVKTDSADEMTDSQPSESDSATSTDNAADKLKAAMEAAKKRAAARKAKQQADEQ